MISFQAHLQLSWILCFVMYARTFLVCILIAVMKFYFTHAPIHEVRKLYCIHKIFAEPLLNSHDIYKIVIEVAIISVFHIQVTFEKGELKNTSFSREREKCRLNEISGYGTLFVSKNTRRLQPKE